MATVTTNDPIVAPSRITAAKVKAWYVDNWGPVPTAVAQYLDEAERLCGAAGRSPALNMDFLLFVAQSVVETANPDTGKPWMSPRWLRNHNPAGLAVESDGDPDPAKFTATEAAVVQYWAWLYMTRRTSTQVFPPPSANAFVGRWTAKIEDRTFPYPVRTVADLCRHYVDSTGEPQAVWAWDETYATQLVARANEIARFAKEEPQMPDLNMTKGLIPLPAIDDDIVDVSRRSQSDACRGYDNLGRRPEIPKFLVLHRAQMAPEGSNSGYFHSSCCPALTDLEVNCVTGRMKRFVGRGDAPSGWANGRVSGPYGDALAWLELHGWDLNTVNRDGEACEITGWFLQPGEPSHEDPVADVCWGALAQWIASRAHDYGITWLDFPLIPLEGGRSYVTWHQEWTIGTGKVCPGMTVMQGTPALIERARAIMRAAQTGTKPSNPPIYAPSELPDWWAESLSRSHPSDTVDAQGRWWVQRRNFECVKTTTERRCRPDIKAKVSGPPVIAGEKIWAERLLEADRDWLVTTDGHYLLASAFSPNASLKTRKAKAA